MKQFVFTLQTLLDLTLATEKQQKIEMKQIEARLAALFLELDEMQLAFGAAREKQAEEIAKRMQSERLQQYGAYFESLNAAMIRQRENIQKTETEKEKLLQQQINTRKEIKTLEKLQKTQYEEYLLELRREEEKAIGDLVSYKASVK